MAKQAPKVVPKKSTMQNMRPTGSNVIEIEEDDDFESATPMATNRTLATEVSIPMPSSTGGKKRQLPLNFGSQSVGRKSSLTSNWE